jgi:hypothetical protein
MPFFEWRAFARSAIGFAFCLVGWSAALVSFLFLGLAIWGRYSGSGDDGVDVELFAPALVALLSGLLLTWTARGVLRGSRLLTGLSVIVAMVCSARYMQIATYKTPLSNQLQLAQMAVIFLVIAAAGLWLSVSRDRSLETR